MYRFSKRVSLLLLSFTMFLVQACASAPPPQPIPPTPPAPVGGGSPAAPAKPEDEFLVRITPDLVEKAKAEGKVTVQYTSQPNVINSYVKAFREEYPFIQVNVERKAGAAGAQVLQQEFQANVRRVDVVQASDLALNLDLVAAGVFAKVVPETVDLFPDGFKVVPYLYSPVKHRAVVLYNATMVTDAEAEGLKQWNAILDPKWKRNFNLVPPTLPVVSAPLLQVMRTPGMGVDFLKKLYDQDPVIYQNTAQSRDAVVAGQQAISWGAQWESTAIVLVETGAPVRFVYPDPTTEWAGPQWGVVSNAPNPNAARLFWAWLLTKKAATALWQTGEANERSSLIGVEDTRESITKLKQTSWFKEPVNTNVPSIDDWKTKSAPDREAWFDALHYNP